MARNTAGEPRSLPLGSKLGPTIERFREIVAASQDALSTEGPAHPDRELFDLCSVALHLLLTASKTHKRHHGIACDVSRPWTTAERAEWHELFNRWDALEKQTSSLMRRAADIRATTPAGIYAKALIVRASVTRASHLAKTLAEALIACDGLRAVLWPTPLRHCIS